MLVLDRQHLKQLVELKRKELRRLKKATYLTIDDLLDIDFHKQPKTIIIEAGNGLGKTQSYCDYVSLIQQLEYFERIYILNFSHAGCRNVVDKLTKRDCKVIWYVGIEKHCPNVSLLQRVNRLIGVPSQACYICPFWRPRFRYIYVKFVKELQDKDIKVVKPRTTYIPVRTCTQPIFRAYVLDPTFEEKRGLNLDFTPVIVIPSQLFLTHTVISRFEKYQRRQKKERKELLIIDEADTIFYNSLIIELPIIDFTQTDYQILRMFSPKTRRLERLIDLYKLVLDLCEDIVRNRGFISKHHIDRYFNYVQHIDKLLRSFNRRRKEILEYVVNNRVKTNIFVMVNALEKFIRISSPVYTLKTVEKQGDKYILYDYDYAFRVLFDVEYPFKYFWKIVLSATFPTQEILTSRFISPTTKRAITRVQKKYKTYVNVYVSDYPIFPQEYIPINRNQMIRYVLDKVLKCIYVAVKSYHEYFGEDAKGVVVWFGNKYQYNVFLQTIKKYLAKYNVMVIERNYYSYFEANIDGEKLTIIVSYCGSPFSRSVDLDQYNISIVVAPLLRPARNGRYWDVVDYSKAIADTIQALMRIVRSPRPQQPKLIILESRLLNDRYIKLLPKWFHDLLYESYIDLLTR